MKFTAKKISSIESKGLLFKIHFAVPHTSLVMRILPLTLIAVLAAMAHCSEVAFSADMKPYTYNRAFMGTQVYLYLYAEKEKAAVDAAAAAFARIEKINSVASDYMPESELSRINRAPVNQAIPLSEDMWKLLSQSREFSKRTEGAFDVTVGYAAQLWRRAKRLNKLASPKESEKGKLLTDWKALQLDEDKKTLTKLKEGQLIDLGGIGKGYAADVALAELKKHGVCQALVAASGDLAVGDAPPGHEGWEVKLRTFEKEEGRDRLIKVLLKNAGCSTSGDLHQSLIINGKRYSHIIDPRTGVGLTDRVACSIVAESAIASDAMATAVCIMGWEKAQDVLDDDDMSARFAKLDEDGKIVTSIAGKFPTLPEPVEKSPNP